MSTQLQIGTIKKGLALTKNYLVKQSPILLTIAAVGGVVTTTVLAVRAGIKAERLIEEEKAKKELQIDEKLTIEETVKTVWKEYIPTVVSGVLTIAAIVGSSAINEKRKAALAGLYALSETALTEYQGKVKDILGEKKAEEIQAAVSQKGVLDKEVPPQYTTLDTGKCLVFDRWSGRYFMSSIQDLKVAEAQFNKQLLMDISASLNEFYGYIGLDSIELGDDVGWTVDHQCNLRFDSCLTSEGMPCLVMDHNNRPSPDYRDIR